MLSALVQRGAPVEKHLRAVGLDRFKTSVSKASLPASLVFDLFERLRRKEFSADVVADLGNAYRLGNMAHWGQTLLAAPGFLNAAVCAGQSNMSIISFNHVDLEIFGPVAEIVDRYEIDPSRNTQLAEDLSLSLLLDSMSVFGGEGWRLLCKSEMH